MLTFLTVEKAGANKIFPLRRKIVTETKSSEGIDVKYIKYIYRGNKIRWDKIRKLCADDADRLLCKEDTPIPPDVGIRRFCSDELKTRLALNMAVEVLRRCKGGEKSIKVAVYDPDGILADAVGTILKYTDSLAAVTRMTGMYLAEAERIMAESGAVLGVSKSMRSLSEAQLVLAPIKLRTVLPLDKRAVVLTVDEPMCAQRCCVLSRYFWQLEEGLACLLPKDIYGEYFASALYTLCSRYDLGSALPQVAKGVGVEHTVISLSRYLTNIALNT